MSNYKDLKLDKFKDNTDIVDSGTEGFKMPVGTTAQRGSTTGQIRFNSTTGLAEYYDGSGFKSIDSAPTVTSISPTDVESSSLPSNITITGTNFGSAVSVTFIDVNNTETASPTVTRDSSTQITAQVPNTITSANEPFDIKVTNTSSNLANTLADALNIDAAPVFSVASGSLGTLFDGGRSASNLTALTATDDENDTVTFSITTGSAPSGITLNSNGTWSGTANAVGSNTTSTFTVTASDGNNTSTRQYSITVNAPSYSVFNSNGTWNVPTGVVTVQVLVVAGGGAGGTTQGVGGGANLRGAGGGAGGLIFIPSWDVTGASSYSVVVGSGGTVSSGNSTSGQNSTVSGGSKTLTALGGGHGGFSDNTNNHEAGGSGGGPWYPTYTGQSGTQPANTSDGVNTYNGTGYGNKGGNSSSASPYGGGGGGATSAGQNYNQGQQGGTGFDGNSYGLGSYGESGYFASGGTSASYGGTNTSTRIGGGGAGYNNSTNLPSNSAANGQANTGGGGGSGGNGGSGVVIFKY